MRNNSKNCKICFPNQYHKQQGSVMIEATFGILLFTIVFLFTLFFYEIIETKHEAQILSGQLLREEMLAKQGECYQVARAEVSMPVRLQYNIAKFVGVQEVPIEVSKIGYAGSCPGIGRSYFHHDNYREARGPGS